LPRNRYRLATTPRGHGAARQPAVARESPGSDRTAPSPTASEARSAAVARECQTAPPADPWAVLSGRRVVPYRRAPAPGRGPRPRDVLRAIFAPILPARGPEARAPFPRW